MKALCLLLTFAAAAGAQTSIKLEAVQHYGWAKPDAGTRALTPVEKQLGGGMIGNVAAIAEAADGAVFVLDNLSMKIVVFNRDGTLRRVFGGGQGSGPGEFMRPRSIALSDAGELFVLDQQLQRVTVFDTTGKVKRSWAVTMSQPLHMVVTHDRVYIDRIIVHGQPVVLVYDPKGLLLSKLNIPSEDDEPFGLAGEAFALALMKDGSAVIASPNPGTWSLLPSMTKHFGHAIVANNRVWENPTDKGKYRAPASIRGLGELTDGRVLVYYQSYDPASFKAPYTIRFRYNLAALKPDGSLIETVPMAESFRHLLVVSRSGTEFFLAMSEPFPQVVRFRMK